MRGYKKFNKLESAMQTDPWRNGIMSCKIGIKEIIMEFDTCGK